MLENYEYSEFQDFYLKIIPKNVIFQYVNQKIILLKATNFLMISLFFAIILQYTIINRHQLNESSSSTT